MINKDSVIPIRVGFVQVNRLEDNQFVKGYNTFYLLKALSMLTVENPVEVQTKSLGIIVSPQQTFITSSKDYTEACNLQLGQRVLTFDGFDEITSINQIEGLFDMFNVVTTSKIYNADGFVLISDLFI